MRLKIFFAGILCLLVASVSVLQAQNASRQVSGTVVDEANEPLVGVNVLVVGTSTGAITDIDGAFMLTVPADTRELQFSYIGYTAQTLPIPATGRMQVQLQPDALMLGDVVVIGYGTQRKSDLTGSVSNVSSKDFNAGLISSPEQLINGKVSGLQIMSNGGSPTSGSTIRIRGGASLNASNDPLIVLDGVPLESGGISGNSSNFLSLINPADIESMTVLKDASSTAIYGSRASNGVLIITTKKGTGDGLKVSFSSTNSIQTTTRMVDMLSASQFTDIINERGTAAQQSLLGSTSTNWNDQIFSSAFGTDENLSLSGRIAPNWPLRVSVGYYAQNGLLERDNAKRLSGNFSLNPSFFDDRLKLGLSAKASFNNNTFGNTGAIWAAAITNPTLPIYDADSQFGGYREEVGNDGRPVNGGVLNPVGLVKQYDSTSKVWRIITNFDVDYRLRLLPELKLHLTAGYDRAQGKGEVYVPAEAAQYFTSEGRDYAYGPQKNENRLLTAYANYNKLLSGIHSNIDATLGYDYQFWKTTSPLYEEYNTAGKVQNQSAAVDQRHALISFYGRLNYTLLDRYMLTATMRRDGTSRFHEDYHWGTFPSVALAWRASREGFLADNPVLSDLKIRASYGVTGQQEGIGNYNYLPVYTQSQEGAEVQFGNNWYHTYRPQAYVKDLKWETTSSWNVGFDFGLFNDRITGSLDYYTRQTKDLLARVPSPAGSNFEKTILTNVGNVDSQGLEFSLNATPIQTTDLTWDLSFNMTWQKMKVKNLSLVDGGEMTNTLVGPSIDSYQFQVLSEGYEPYMFYVYHQLYDEATGRPIEGAYADLNEDGQINSADLYRYQSPAPDFIFGLSTSVRYKKWTLSTSLRANVGNYVYNGMAMNTGAWSTVSYNDAQINNLNSSYLKTGFVNRQYLSDYYVENASFLKMDNLTVNYNFGRIYKTLGLNISAMVQNVFCITNYSGVDPEVPSGMDFTFYPRPRTYSISLGLEF